MLKCKEEIKNDKQNIRVIFTGFCFCVLLRENIHLAALASVHRTECKNWQEHRPNTKMYVMKVAHKMTTTQKQETLTDTHTHTHPSPGFYCSDLLLLSNIKRMSVVKERGLELIKVWMHSEQQQPGQLSWNGGGSVFVCRRRGEARG